MLKIGSFRVFWSFFEVEVDLLESRIYKAPPSFKARAGSALSLKSIILGERIRGVFFSLLLLSLDLKRLVH